ncbi:BNR-4 repeat-containing protein [Neiella sp. HB171785]|uniref:BNR-4 repeat-containing protein n=2 Tax=Neiella litorisoli TaxID=2771431 RepID=A0A8J6QVN9_9GAMM|nr:BNR-4 repeat-containing protein [Neiella litorisoli]
MSILCSSAANAEVRLESSTKIADNALHFDGVKVGAGTPDNGTDKYDYLYGPQISAHGDSVKTYKHYVFTTWYRGGKDDRHVMLTRYNTLTGTKATIEFPHQHTGYIGERHIGESHNTIAVAISPINGTIHLLYDMHGYSPWRPSDGEFKNDYFRYSFSYEGAAEVSDENFTLDQFVKDTSAISEGPDDYKHLTMTGNLADKQAYQKQTYPTFFTNTDGTLLLYMRKGSDSNGSYEFCRYDAAAQKWSLFTKFNVENAATQFGNDYNWGLYGNMKYVNGKLRVGFQQRTALKDDRYTHQNGVYYAYSDHPEGFADWKNHRGENMTLPLVNSDEIKVFEPGDFITGHEDANSVYMVSYFDWTVTDRGDIHIISRVRSADSKRADFQKVHIHSYKPAGSDEFIHSTDFAGATNIYTAGENVYIIGLTTKGYPFIEKTLGGTDQFTRIYEATEGTTFSHGRVHINDGKLYYYLMEKSDGNARPVHLQVIDLDIESDKNAPEVKFPFSSKTVDEGYEKLIFEVKATAVEDRSIESVTLYINDQLVRVDDSYKFLFGHASKPHETGAMGWLDTHSPNPNPLPPGTHTFKAVALDSEGATGVATMTLTVLSDGPVVAFPAPQMTVNEGYEQLEFRVDASSPVEGRTIESVTLYINDELVRVDTKPSWHFGHKYNAHETGAMGWISCDQDPVPSPCHQPNPNPLTAGEHVFKAVAVDSAGESSEATMKLIVKAAPKPPVLTWPNEVVTVYEGYPQLMQILKAESPNPGGSIKSVTLYRNGELVRVDTKPSWNFGHPYAPYELGAMGWISCDQDPVPSPCHQPNPDPLGVGSHTFTAVAKDNIGLETSASMTLVVEEVPAPNVAFVDAEMDLSVGYQDFSASVTASSLVDWVAIEHSALYLDDMLVGEIYDAPFTWTADDYPTELLGAAAGTHRLKAVVTDSNGRSSEVEMSFTVKPSVVFADSEVEGFEASNLFDGDASDSSSWSAANNGTKNVILDLGAVKTIVGTKLWTTEGQAVKYQVYVANSLDDEFVKVAKHQNKNDDAQPTVTEFYAQGRYVKLMAIGNWPNINELEVLFE